MRMETKRLKGQTQADFSYCKFRSNKLKCARQISPLEFRGVGVVEQQEPSNWLPLVAREIPSVSAAHSKRQWEAHNSQMYGRTKMATPSSWQQSSFSERGAFVGRKPNAMSKFLLGAPISQAYELACKLNDGQHSTSDKKPNVSRRPISATAVLIAFLLLNLIDWQSTTSTTRQAHQQRSFSPSQQGHRVATISTTKSNLNYESILRLLLPIGPLVAVGQQYKPDWAQKLIEQEIFLLNLEDGYFGCQVNASQDFLQLFELSRLCDGQPQCYLGSDELSTQLKCRDRDRCETISSGANNLTSVLLGGPQNEELVKCVNGVCLDGLCYCNDGFGGKSCDIPDENECKFRPCDVFAHCTNTMGSYYCSCFPGKLSASREFEYTCAHLSTP